MKQESIFAILSKAIQQAETLNIDIAVSIVDKGGHLVGFMRTAECSFAAIDVSKKKAATACAFKIPTDVIGGIVQSNPFIKEAFESFNDVFYFGGGLPIIEDGKLIGGIGVSGAEPMQDKEIAEKAIG
jgi:uncharacterized protein GlcG (DUF336 family)